MTMKNTEVSKRKAGVLTAIMLSWILAGGTSATSDAVVLADVEKNESFGIWTGHKLVVEGVLQDGLDLEIYLGVQDERILQTYGSVPGRDEVVDDINVKHLTYDNGTFSGYLRTGPIWVTDDNDDDVICSLTIDVSIDQGTVSGTYRGVRLLKVGDDAVVVDTNAWVVPPEYLRWETSSPTEVSGTVSGTTITEEDVREKNGFSGDHDWPFWNGPNCNFSASPSDNELLDDFSKARLVWKSEHTLPGRSQSTRHGSADRFLARGGPTGGGSSPILYDNRVYFYYFSPVGDEIGYESQIETNRERQKSSCIDFWWKRADDIVLCLDAETGKTLWKTTFQKSGFNILGAKGSYTGNLAAADDKIVGALTGEKVFCLNAKTGKLLWETTEGWGVHRVISNGIVLCNVGGMLVALDLESGTEVWREEKMMHKNACPVVWKNSGKEYFLVADAGSESQGIGAVVRCLEPATGNEKWQFQTDGLTDGMLVADENHLIIQGMPFGEEDYEYGVRCYEISEDGCEPAWNTDEVFYRGTRAATMHNGIAYLKHWKDDPRYYEMVAIRLSDGEILYRRPVHYHKHGYSYFMDDKVLTEWDATHTGPTALIVNTPADEEFKVQHDGWKAPHFGTVGYHPDLMTHIFADGRFIVRGGWGIHCYDLRKDGETQIDRTNRGGTTTSAKVHADIHQGGGTLKISLPQNVTAGTVEIVRPDGRSVLHVKTDNSQMTIPLSGQASGLYTLVLRMGNSRIVKRIVNP